MKRLTMSGLASAAGLALLSLAPNANAGVIVSNGTGPGTWSYQTNDPGLPGCILGPKGAWASVPVPPSYANAEQWALYYQEIEAADLTYCAPTASGAPPSSNY
jgi:hypothetical protein